MKINYTVHNYLELVSCFLAIPKSSKASSLMMHRGTSYRIRFFFYSSSVNYKILIVYSFSIFCGITCRKFFLYLLICDEIVLCGLSSFIDAKEGYWLIPQSTCLIILESFDHNSFIHKEFLDLKTLCMCTRVRVYVLISYSLNIITFVNVAHTAELKFGFCFKR